MNIEQVWPIENVAAALPGEAEASFAMDESGFREFYAATAPRLRAYLIKVSRNLTLADDLLQESYFRLLRADFTPVNEEHRKNYLYRIATNLMRDHFRRSKRETEELPESLPSREKMAESVTLRADMSKMLERLNPRDRQLLWLAYVEGSSHREISEVTGLRTASIRPMLFRARQRMAEMLREAGFRPRQGGTQ